MAISLASVDSSTIKRHKFPSIPLHGLHLAPSSQLMNGPQLSHAPLICRYIPFHTMAISLASVDSSAIKRHKFPSIPLHGLHLAPSSQLMNGPHLRDLHRVVDQSARSLREYLRQRSASRDARHVCMRGSSRQVDKHYSS